MYIFMSFQMICEKEKFPFNSVFQEHLDLSPACLCCLPACTPIHGYPDMQQLQGQQTPPKELKESKARVSWRPWTLRTSQKSAGAAHLQPTHTAGQSHLGSAKF